MSPLRPTTDGVVTIRPPRQEDVGTLIRGRDEVFQRFLGDGSPEPWPTGCIVVGGDLVGWVDADPDAPGLRPGAVNVGYHLFPSHRGRGYATRAVMLLVHHLAVSTDHTKGRLLIDPENGPSLALAGRAGFAPTGEVDGSRAFQRPVPPLAYTDGGVTIRPRRADDLDADLEAKDAEQIGWLWLPGQRESWEAMSAADRRTHALRGLETNAASFGTGPTWTFSVDTPGASNVAYVDCDLANDHVLAGDANVSYACHPAHRGRGHVSRAVRLVCAFLGDHTGARSAHLIVDADNEASLRVARAVDARATEQWTTDDGRPMVRHVRDL